MNSYEKFDIECSSEIFVEVFGKDYLNGDYLVPKKLEINGKKFEHQVSGFDIVWVDDTGGACNASVQGYLRKAPTEKEILEEKIQRLKLELKQAKNKLEEMEDD